LTVMFELGLNRTSILAEFDIKSNAVSEKEHKRTSQLMIA